MRCFITVGSTEFDALIAAATAPKCLEKMHRLGITELLIQMGGGKIELQEGQRCGVNIDFYNYKDDISTDIAEADLVIGHAGAGTCLEVLRARKPLVVVINEELMDNHQRELADRLAELGHVLCTLPNGLAKVLELPELFQRKPFPQPDYRILTTIIDRYMGIVD